MLTCRKFNRYWSRLRFNTNVRCDTLVNNMSEAFNNVIVDARSKPIITMLEDIRLYMMNRWASNRLKVSSFEGSIYPRIRDRLDKELQLTKYWVPRYCSPLIGLFYIFKIVTGLIICVLFLMNIVGQQTSFLRSDMCLLLVRSLWLMWTTWKVVAGNGVLLTSHAHIRWLQ